MTKKLYSSRDAAPAVLHGVRDAESSDAYPILVDEYGGLSSSAGLSHKQQRVEYNANGQSEYVGEAAKGISESAASWLLHKLEYNVTGQFVKRTIAYDSWDNYLTADYS